MAAAVVVVAVNAAAISAGNGYKNSGALLLRRPFYFARLVNPFPSEILRLERLSQRHIAGIFALKSTQSNPER